MSDDARDMAARIPSPAREERRGLPLRRRQYLAISVVYLVLFLLLSRLSIMYFAQAYEISAFYPPAGLTVVLLLLFGLRFLPVVLPVTLLAESFVWPVSWPDMPALPVSLIITAGYGLAVLVLQRVARLDPRLRNTRDMAAFLYTALMAALLIGLGAVAVLVRAGLVPAAAYASSVIAWWVGDALGILAVAPLLLRWLAPYAGRARAARARRLHGWALVEAGVWLLGTLLIIHYVFTVSAAVLFRLEYFLFLPVIWIGIRWGVGGAAAGVLVTTAGATVAMWTQLTPATPLLDVQFFMLVLAATGLLLGAVVSERRQLERQYEEERALLASAVGLLPIPMLFLDPEGRVLRANEASRDFFPTHVREWGEVTLLTADTRAPLLAEQRPAASALREGARRSLECILVLSDGREVPVLIHAAPIEVHGRLVGAVVAIQDITGLKEADRAKDRFLDVLSHELKTPLTSILSWTQAARDDLRVAPRALEVIERNAWAQRRILDDLLDVSRILHGKLALFPARADLWRLAEETAGEATEAIAQRGLTLTLEAPEEPLPIFADAARLRKAIGNLLENAIKFTEPGGAITLLAYRDGAQAVLTIRDTGRGIPPELLGTLFAPFRQIQRTEITGGLGLGLMLVKGIVELHGGRITAGSAGPGKGSVFTVTLPLAA